MSNSPRRASPDATDLQSRASEIPGVAEVMRVYARAQEELSYFHPAMKALQPKVVFKTSDTSA